MPISSKYVIVVPARLGLRGEQVAGKGKYKENIQFQTETKNSEIIQKRLSPEIYYSFFKMSFVDRLEILKKLKSYKDSDMEKGPIEATKRGVLRIIKSGKIEEFEKLLNSSS